MIKKIRKTVSGHRLIKSGDSIIVALSGGADSVSLLHALLELKDEMSLKIYAAHVNHNIRGDEAFRDESFVRSICANWDVELFIKSVDIPKLSKERGESEELCARNIRYEFFSELSERLSAKIATAHTLSDSEETMLYNISRGTSLHGLCSIPYKRGNIIRPLLDVTREEVEEYIRNNNLFYVEDSTNSDENICKRNKIRKSVIPPLKSLNDGFHENFSRLRAQLIETDSFMLDMAKSALKKAECRYGYDCEKLLANHKAVLSYGLSILLSSWGISPQQKYIELLRGILKNGGAVPLAKGKTAVARQGILRLAEGYCEDFTEAQLEIPMEITCFGKKYLVKEINSKEINKKFSDSLISCDRITLETVIRVRKPSDTFAPLGRKVNKNLRKLQNEMRIPAEIRDTSLVIAEGSKVLWAENLGVSEDGKLLKGDERALLIEVKNV